MKGMYSTGRETRWKRNADVGRWTQAAVRKVRECAYPRRNYVKGVGHDGTNAKARIKTHPSRTEHSVSTALEAPFEIERDGREYSLCIYTWPW
jgi:hypothetical protein